MGAHAPSFRLGKEMVCLLLQAVLTSSFAEANPARRTIDIVEGPVLAPLRVTGIGGAFAGYAEGVDAIAANAAASCVRPPYSATRFDHDLSAGLTFPAAFAGDDFDNDGREDGNYDHFWLFTLGASVQVGHFGAGILGEFQQYRLRPTSGSTTPYTVTLGRVHAVMGYGLFGGQLAIGGGLRIATLSVDAAQGVVGANLLSSRNLLTVMGAAPQIGFLIRPDDEPWRIGFTFRAPVSASIPDLSDHSVSLGFDMPDNVHMPWEIEAGFALQAGARPLNPHWRHPDEDRRAFRRDLEVSRASRRATLGAEVAALADRDARRRRSEELRTQQEALERAEEESWARADELLLSERTARYRNWPRARLTVVGEVLLTGSSHNGASPQSIFAGQPRTSGEALTWSPRLGLEGEPVIDWLQVRIGSYIEPSRISGGLPRQHFTLGFDVRLFSWDGFGATPGQIWRLTGLMDVASLYQSVGLSIGAWH